MTVLGTGVGGTYQTSNPCEICVQCLHSFRRDMCIHCNAFICRVQNRRASLPDANTYTHQSYYTHQKRCEVCNALSCQRRRASLSSFYIVVLTSVFLSSLKRLHPCCTFVAACCYCLLLPRCDLVYFAGRAIGTDVDQGKYATAIS